MDARDEGRFDATWVVLDAERASTSGIARALETARSEGLRIALSSPSFEVWLLLHGGSQAAHLSASEAKRRCREQFGIPRRNGKRPTFDDPRLGAGWRVAAAHAGRDREARLADDPTRSPVAHELVLACNPSSNLDELLHAIRGARAGGAAS